MWSRIMKLRSGATDSGRSYEYKMAALFAFRMALDETVKDFWIASNIEGVGDFDDVVLVKEDISGSKSMFCVQLKHVDNRKVELKSMEGLVKKYKGTDTRFSLKKYQTSYETIKENLRKKLFEDITIDNIYLILYTNANLSGKGTSITAKPVEAFNFLDTCSNDKSAKNKFATFQIANSPTSADPYDEDFLSRFYFYTSQAKADSIDGLAKQEICSHFQDIGNAEIVNITDYFAKWAQGRKGEILKLSKQDIEIKLLELLLYPHIMNPYGYIEDNSNTMQLLNATLINFNITNFSQKNLVGYVLGMLKYILEELYEIKIDVAHSWDTNLTQEQLNIVYGIQDVNKKDTVINALKLRQHFVPHLTFKDLYWTAWTCKLVPLIIDCELFQHKIVGALNKFINISKDSSFVVYNPTVLAVNENLFKFNNLSNLTNLELLERNLENLYLSLQGKQRISIKTFSGDADILSQITPNIYLQLLCESLIVGDNYEMESYYVKRKIVRPKLTSDVLHRKNLFKEKKRSKESKGDLFLIVNEKELLPFWYEKNKMSLVEYIKNLQTEEQDIENIHILTTDQEFNGKLLNTVKSIFQRTNKSIHVLSLINENFLEWLYSEGSIEILEEYIVDLESERFSPNSFPEESLTHYLQKRTNVICDNAGMGKTLILKSIANKYQPDEWVTFLNLSDHYSELIKCKTILDIFTFVFKVQMNDESMQQFFYTIFIYCLGNSKLIFLFDGYDEVASYEMLTILLAVLNVKTTRVWITTRPQSRFEVERLLETFSIELSTFDEKDQYMFLKSYFQYKSDIYNYSLDQIEYAISRIQMYSASLDKTLSGVPLQSRMFAEIMGDDINKLGENENFTVIDLYNEFIDIKLKEYKQYEAVSLKRTLSKLALKSVFVEEHIKELVDLEELNEDAVAFKESYKKDSIITGISRNGDALFAHRTFAEFLIAQILAQKMTNKNISDNNKALWLGLIEKMFYKELQPVRLFFDRILSKNLPLHTLVLSNENLNIATFLQNNEKYITDVDCFGRSALHLAVSHGRFYDIYNVKTLTGIRNFGLHPEVTERNENIEFQIPKPKVNQVDIDVVETLLKYKFLNNKDTLFNFDVFDYAYKSCSLKSLNLLYKKFGKNDLNLSEEFDLKLFLYCIVYLNLSDILCNMNDFKENSSLSSLRSIFQENKHLFQKRYNNYYLIEQAATQNSIDVIVILLKCGLSKITDGYPLHRACYNGHAESLQLLFEQGAQINDYDEQAVSPILISGMQGRSDITYRLLKNRNFTNNTSIFFTPLHYACQGGHLGCTSLLIQLGADVNKTDYVGLPPIYYAALYGYSNVIKELTKVKHDQGVYEQALEVATYNNDKESVKSLLETGVNINTKLTEGKTVLMLACINGNSNVVKYLTSLKDCNINMLNTDENTKSIMLWAPKHKHINLPAILIHLTSGSKSAEGGVSALHYAVMYGHSDVVKALLDAGADYRVKDGIGLHYPPLAWAGLLGKANVIKILLDIKHDRNDIDLAVTCSALIGHSECISCLLEDYKPPDPNKITYEASEEIKKIMTAEFAIEIKLKRLNTNDNAPLLLAAKNGHAEVIKELTSRKYRNNEDINEALLWAAREGKTNAVKELLVSGADKNYTDNIVGLKYLPIVWACMYGRTEVVEYLLKLESPKSLENYELHFALNWAALGGHDKLVKLLIDFGMNVDTIDDRLDNNTPLMCACEYRGTPEVVDILLLHNCNINIKNKNEESAIDLAVKLNKFDLVQIIILHSSFKIPEDGVLPATSENLQLTMEWAKSNDKLNLLRKLVELSINDKN